MLYVADDPNVYYGMVEQDSRHYARLAAAPMLMPATPQQALGFHPAGLRPLGTDRTSCDDPGNDDLVQLFRNGDAREETDHSSGSFFRI